MLTVDFRRFPVGPGDRVLDLGCGGGRHAYEAYRRGADVIACDTDQAELATVAGMAAAMHGAGEAPATAHARPVAGDGTAMPFGNGVFDRVIAAEVLEHVGDDQRALHEIARVLRPGGLLAVTVPAWLPERICWGLSDDYHNVPGGHVRIYTRPELEAKLRRAGLTVGGHHHAHGLHSPYWWLKCAVGVGDDDHPLARAYHRLLVWDIMKRPAATRVAERALNPLIGKSLVLYARKPVSQPGGDGRGAGRRARMPVRETHPVPAVPGVLTAADIRATGESIVAIQEPSGAIGWPDGHTDAWNHVECAMALSACGLRGPARRAYDWLRASQRADGSWPKRTAAGGGVTDPATESNQVAYVAVGVWHELLVTGDTSFAARMWPTVRSAIGSVLALQAPRGEIAWERRADGSPASYALLTGCSSIYQSLRCAVALAEFVGQPQPDWELAAGQLGHVVGSHPEAFADKSRFSMDWYYPVLAGAVRGAGAVARLAAGWPDFVVPGLGVRCVSDQPWVTGAETCELVLALDANGDRGRAVELLRDIQHLRDADGAYWTGWQFANQAHFPAERSSWTAAAMILAADALAGASGAAGLFRDAGPDGAALPPADADACGCALTATS